MAPAALLLVLLSCLGVAMCTNDNCSIYEHHIRPLVERGDVTGLQRAFKVMNNETRSLLTFRVSPVDSTVWPEVAAVRHLLSLSRPLLDMMGRADAWPENNNIRVYLPGAADVFTPATSYHGGLRYIYNCVTLLTRTCYRDVYLYDPGKPIHGNIFVPRENFLAGNGDDMDNHLTSDDAGGSPTYLVRGFGRLSLKECSARQVFYSGEGCFEDLRFFSLPEAVEARSVSENISDPNTFLPESLTVSKQYFVVMS